MAKSSIDVLTRETGDLLSQRVMLECSFGHNPNDLYAIIVDSDNPLVFTEERILEMINEAPNALIRETLIAFSNREKEEGKIRLLVFNEGEGEEMFFCQAIIPNYVNSKLQEIENGKVIN